MVSLTTDSPQRNVTVTTPPWPSVSSKFILRVRLGVTVFCILALSHITLGVTAKEVRRNDLPGCQLYLLNKPDIIPALLTFLLYQWAAPIPRAPRQSLPPAEQPSPQADAFPPPTSFYDQTRLFLLTKSWLSLWRSENEIQCKQSAM